MTRTQSPALTRTRESWHRVAEHVLAAGQFAASGTIRLRPSPGGFSTTAGVGGRQLAVDGLTFVVAEGGARRTTPLTTVGDLADFAGVRPGLSGSYSPATPADPDLPLPCDEDSAGVLAEWFALGDAALRRFGARFGEPQEPVLWPEHLDLALTVGAVTYGCSPGDAATGEPYLYVAPHAGPPVADEFWNAPFGASITAERIRGVDEALDFFTQGQEREKRSGT